MCATLASIAAASSILFAGRSEKKIKMMMPAVRRYVGSGLCCGDKQRTQLMETSYPARLGNSWISERSSRGDHACAALHRRTLSPIAAHIRETSFFSFSYSACSRPLVLCYFLLKGTQTKNTANQFGTSFVARYPKSSTIAFMY